jgi:hypothetical protein
MLLREVVVWEEERASLDVGFYIKEVSNVGYLGPVTDLGPRLNTQADKLRQTF